MSDMLLLVCVGSSIFSLISGLTLSSNGSFITTDAFYLVCDVQGSITSSVTFIDPAGATVGLCLAPPLTCFSAVGNTLERDLTKGTVTISIAPNNVQIPASEGNWSCTDGSVAEYFLVKIHSYTKPVIQTEVTVPITGTVITVLIGCIHPYPDEVKISYVKKSAQNNVLKSRNDVKFDNGTSTNCPVPDTRAISINGTFLVSTDNLNGEEALIAVTVLLNGIQLGMPGYSNFSILSEKGLTTPSSTINSDMSTTVSEPSPTFSSDMSTTASEPSPTFSSHMSTTASEPSPTFSSDISPTVSKAPIPPNTASSAGLSQEIVIAIVISSALAAGALILLVVLVVRKCREKNKETPEKNKENNFANKQNNLTKKDDLKSYKPRKSKLSEKRNTKLGSTSLDKKKDAQLENFASKDRMYRHYPQTTDYWNNCRNQHVFNNSHNEGNMMFYRNWHDNYLRPHSRPNNRMPYQSHYPPYPGHNEGMFQYCRADNLYRGQQMYQMPYVALYDKHDIINDKQDGKRSSKGRQYEKNWDLLY